MEEHYINTCLICMKPVDNYEPEYCCNGHECGCRGYPTNPCVCSRECDDALYDDIGLTMDQRRIKAGIDLYQQPNKQGD